MDQTSQASQQTPAQKKSSKRPIVVTVVTAAAVVILSVLGVYFWQQGVVKKVSDQKDLLDAEVASQSASIKSLDGENDELMSKVSFLEKALKEATASAGFELGEISLSDIKAKHYTYNDEGGDADNVLVDITIKNETENTLYLSVENFKLKDSSNKAYQMLTPNYYDLPGGRVWLTNQQVAPGEAVLGTVAFWAPASKNLYTLIYNSRKKTVTVN